MTQDCELTIVMPCLNEAETLETCIRKAQGFLERHKVDGEVVIGDNGSTDSSIEIARRCQARVVHVPVKGYGAALYYAIRAARGKYVIMADSDDSYDLSNLMPFLEQLRQGCDLVMGNRFAGGVLPGAMPWKNRFIGNPILSGIGRLFFRCPVRDFHCGIRGFSREAFERMDLRTTGMEFASEMVIKATLLKMNVVEVPTCLHPDGRSRRPHLRPWRDGWRHLRFMLLYSPRWLFLYPGLALMLLGLLLVVWLYPHARYVGGIRWDTQTMLYGAIAAVLGYQSVVFALLAKVFAVNEGLLPPDPKVRKFLDRLPLETGLLAGGMMALAGLVGTVAVLVYWGNLSFGMLDYAFVVRQVILSMLGLILGAQTILASFFLSILGLRLRRMDPGADLLVEEPGQAPQAARSSP